MPIIAIVLLRRICRFVIRVIVNVKKVCKSRNILMLAAVMIKMSKKCRKLYNLFGKRVIGGKLKQKQYD